MRRNKACVITVAIFLTLLIASPYLGLKPTTVKANGESTVYSGVISTVDGSHNCIYANGTLAFITLKIDVECPNLGLWDNWENYTEIQISGGDANQIEAYIFADKIQVNVDDNGTRILGTDTIETSVSLGSNITFTFQHDGNLTIFNDDVQIYTDYVTGGDGFPYGFNNAHFIFTDGDGSITYVLEVGTDILLSPTLTSSGDRIYSFMEGLKDFSMEVDAEITGLTTLEDGTGHIDFMTSGEGDSSVNGVAMILYSDNILLLVLDDGSYNPLIDEITIVATSISVGSNITMLFMHDGNITLFNDETPIYTHEVTGGAGYVHGFNLFRYEADGTGGEATVTINDLSGLPSPTPTSYPPGIPPSTTPTPTPPLASVPSVVTSTVNVNLILWSVGIAVAAVVVLGFLVVKLRKKW